jgi:hypothetical protein
MGAAEMMDSKTDRKDLCLFATTSVSDTDNGYWPVISLVLVPTSDKKDSVNNYIIINIINRNTKSVT